MKATNWLIASISLTLTCGLLEGSARWARESILPPRTEYEFRITRPEPYRDAEYFSRGFIAESFAQPGEWITPEGTRLVLPADFEGEWFNVRDHRRVTVGQPDSAAHTLYLFGGSTVYCSEVPDELTLPSQLQALINESGLSYRVENYGVTTANMRQQFERLKTVDIHEGDLVVFYDGGNDISQFIQVGDASADGWIIESNRDRMASLTTAQQTRIQIWGALNDQSALIDLLLYPYNRSTPAHLDDPVQIAFLAAALQRHYLATMIEAQRHSEQYGATFYHFVQPSLFARDQHSDYERQLIANPYLVGGWVEDVFEVGYPAVRAASATARDLGIESHDISEVLNASREAGEEFFLDAMHVEDDGNRYIAEAIFEVMFNE